MRLVDTHVHVNFPVLRDEIESVRERWLQAGVERLVHSCVSPQEFDEILALSNRFPEVYCAVGLHPLEAEKQWSPSLGRQIADLAVSSERVVAIGETGLDFYKSDAQSQQMDAFEAQLAIACDLDLPVIIHCREAARATADVLRRFQVDESSRPVRGVMHCWGGNPEETRWFLDLGFYISFSGTSTFKNASIIRESVQIVPDDRLLIETDCPFLAPVPYRGKRNEPAFVAQVAQRLAEVRGESLEDLAARTSANAIALFGLPDPYDLALGASSASDAGRELAPVG